MATALARMAPVSAPATSMANAQLRAPFATSAPAATAKVLGPAAGLPQKRVLYETHMPTSPTQKILVSVASALSVFVDPERGDMLAALGDATGRDALRQVHAKMCSDPTGSRILAERPSIRSDQIDIEYLRALPKDSFGFAYSQFMDAHGFEADGRAYVKFVDDAELAYVMQRYRELHDFWHVLFGLPPTVFGEIILKYVELAQTKLPVCALSGFVGPLRLTSDERRQLLRVYIPWANRAAKNAHFLMNTIYEEEFETPLEELRQRLNVEAAPPVPGRKVK
ncbi:hypothetical protein Gpo141_00004943 [Globisporangium polare]